MAKNQDETRKLIATHSRRLQKLKEQQALFGIDTPPHLLLEIEDIEAEIEKLQADLATRFDYNLVAIRDLLMEAFSAEDLRRLVFEQPEFRSLYESSSSKMSKSEMIYRLIEYSERRLLMNELLRVIRDYNPRQYRRYENQLLLDEPSKQNVDQRIQQLILPEQYTELLDNPYIVGNPIQPDNTKVFVGRYDIAKSIISEIRKGGQKPSILLYGRRRMGKTSALLNINNLLIDMRATNILPVYVSGQSVKFHTNINFCFYLAQAIVEKLRQAAINIDKLRHKKFLEKSKFSENPVLALSEFFEESHKLLEQNKKFCLISIDEYEEIDQHINTGRGIQHDQNITRELLLELRDTLQHKPKYMFLFAGIHYLRDLSNVNWSEIFINVKTLHVSFLQRRDGYRLLTEPVPDLKYQDEKLVSEILEITGCQPFLMQAVASELINVLNTNDVKIATRRYVNLAVNEVLGKYNTYFDYIWDTECETGKQKELLKLVSKGSKGVLENDLDSYQDELRNLIRREVLKTKNGIVSLAMPIVRLWLKENQHIL